jgi:hypothetical protein
VGDVDVQVGVDPDGDARPLQLCDGGDAVGGVQVAVEK